MRTLAKRKPNERRHGSVSGTAKQVKTRQRERDSEGADTRLDGRCAGCSAGADCAGATASFHEKATFYVPRHTHKHLDTSLRT